jgi:hypothetical protein
METGMKWKECLAACSECKSKHIDERISINGADMKVSELEFTPAPVGDADFNYWVEAIRNGQPLDVIFPGGIEGVSYGVHIIGNKNFPAYYRPWDFWHGETPQEIFAHLDETHQ